MAISEYLREFHNVNNLLYHFVCPAKYRRSIFTKPVEEALMQICEGISKRYDWIRFIEIGLDKNHAHFLIQSTPSHSPSEIIRTVKSVTSPTYICGASRGKGKVMGRRAMDRRVFCVHSWSYHDRGGSSKVCARAR